MTIAVGCIHRYSYPHNTLNELHEVYMTFIFTHLWSLCLPCKYSRTQDGALWSTLRWNFPPPTDLPSHLVKTLKLWCISIHLHLVVHPSTPSCSSKLATTLVVHPCLPPLLVEYHSPRRQSTLVKTIYKGINVHSTGDWQVWDPSNQIIFSIYKLHKLPIYMIYHIHKPLHFLPTLIVLFNSTYPTYRNNGYINLAFTK